MEHDNERQKDHYDGQRKRMVEEQIRQRGITAERVLAAMGEVPRHLFVPAESREMAYMDRPLPIGDRQTISQPFIVAMMVAAMELAGSERVLDVGGGSGYSSAIISRLAREVFFIELEPTLAEAARKRLKALGYDNVHVLIGDGSAGWPPAQPFEAISVAAAVPALPQPLFDQLTDGGRLVIPIGDRENQELVQITRRKGNHFRRTLCPCRFVPLIGRYAFPAQEIQ